MIKDQPMTGTLEVSTLTIANAALLCSAVIKKIAGNDLSTAVNGSVLTQDVIQSIVMRNIARSLEGNKQTLP